MLLIMGVLFAGIVFTLLFALVNMLLMSALDYFRDHQMISNILAGISFILGANIILSIILLVCIWAKNTKEKNVCSAIHTNDTI